MAKKAKPQNTALPKLTVLDKKPSTLIDITNKVASTVKAHPSYQAHPEIQAPVTKWVASANAIADYEQKIAALNAQLVALGGERDLAIVDWHRQTRGVITAIDGVTAGDANAITQWGFESSTRVPSPESDEAPTNLRVGYMKNHAFVIRWKAVKGARGYLLQIGDGTATGWGPTIQATRASYVPTGLASGQHIAMRVAVIRKNGQSTWSPMLTAMFR